MSTPEQIAELRSRFAAMQSGGAKVLSNASLALKVLDALAATPVEPAPEIPPVEPDPEPEPPAEPEPDPEPTDPGAVVYGVPEGTDLFGHRAGDISDSDLTLDGALIEGDVTFTGSNVTLRSCHITGHVIFRGRVILVESCDLGSFVLSGAADVTFRRVDVGAETPSGEREGKDSIHITANPTSAEGRTRNVLLDKCRGVATYSAVTGTANHYDGMHVRGVVGLTVRDCVFHQGGRGASRFNSTIFIQDANGGNEGVVIEGCDLSAASYYNLYLASPNVLMRNNRLHRPFVSDGETWNKPMYGDGENNLAPGSEGNVWADDGTPVTW